MTLRRRLSDRAASEESPEAIAEYLNRELIPVVRAIDETADLGRITLRFTDASVRAIFVADRRDLLRFAYQEDDGSLWLVKLDGSLQQIFP